MASVCNVQPDNVATPQPFFDDTKTLPNITSKLQKGQSSDSIYGDNFGPCASPKKQLRRNTLLQYGWGIGGRTALLAELDMDVRGRQAGLAREQQHQIGIRLLEMWLNDVLSRDTADKRQMTLLKSKAISLRGLVKHGITREDLTNAGLPREAIDRLYRGLYVYSVGFFDLLQDLLSSNMYRFELMTNIWRSFVTISEAAMNVAFKSEYLDLVQVHQDHIQQLYVAREALSEARESNTEMEKTLAWLTASHAEERSLRQKISEQMDSFRTRFEKERVGHAHAVKQYLQEMEERSKTQQELSTALENNRQIQDGKSKMEADIWAAEEEHKRLIDTLEGVNEKLSKIQNALNLEDGVGEQGTGVGVLERASEVQKQMEILYEKWQQELRDKRGFQQKYTAILDENHELRSQNAHMTSEVKTGRKKLKEQTQQLDHVTSITNPLQEALARTRTDLDEKKRELRDCVQELEQAHTQNSSLTSQVADMKTVSDGMREQLGDNEKQMLEMSTRTSEMEEVMRCSRNHHEQACVALATCMNSFNFLQGSHRILQNSAADAHRVHSATNERLDEAEEKVAALEEEIEELRGKLNQREMDYLNLSRQKSIIDDRLVTATRADEGHKSEITNLKSNLDTAKQTMNRLAADHEVLQNDYNALKTMHKVLTDEKSNVDKVMQKTENQLADMIKRKDGLEKELQQSAMDKKKAEEESMRNAAFLKTSASKAEARCKSMENKVIKANRELEQKQGEIEHLNTVLEKKRGKKRKWKAALQELTEETEITNKKMAQRVEILKHLNSRIVYLERGLVEVSKVINSGQGALFEPLPSDELGSLLVESGCTPASHALTEQMRLIQAEIDEIRNKDLQDANELLASKEDELAALSCEIDELTGAPQELSSRLSYASKPGAELDVESQSGGKLEKRVMVAESGLSEIQGLCIHDLLREKSDALDKLQEVTARFEERGDEVMEKVKEMEDMEGNLAECNTRISELKAEKNDLDNSLRQSNSMISFLQAEVAALKNERDKQKSHLSEAENKIDNLERLVDASNQTLSGKLKQADVKFDAERRKIQESFAEERRDWDGQLTVKQNELKTVTDAFNESQKTLKEVAISLVRSMELEGSKWLFQVQNAALVLAHKNVGVWKLGNAFDPGTPVIPNLNFSLETLLILISQIYVVKMEKDNEEDQRVCEGSGNRKSLEEVVLEYFMLRFGIRQMAEAHISALIVGVEKYQNNHRRVRMFGQLLGLFNPLPDTGVDFFISMMSRIHNRAGLLLTEATEGCSEIQVHILARIFREVFRGLASVTPEVANLTDRLMSMVGRDENKPIDLDIAIEMAMDAWHIQRQKDEAQVLSMFRHNEAKGNGVFTFEDFQGALRQVNHTQASQIDPKTGQDMFQRAVRTSTAGNKVDAESFARVAFYDGFVGMTIHKRRHEDVEHFPPYDEFRLMEDSWKAARTEVQLCIEKMEKHPRMSNKVGGFKEQVDAFRQALAERESASETWKLYRRVLKFYTMYRSMVESSEQDHLLNSLQAISINLASVKSRDLSRSLSNTERSSTLDSESETTKSSARSGSVFGTRSRNSPRRKMTGRGAIPRKVATLDENSQHDDLESDPFEL